jgi:putative acetyltransferase
MMTITLERTTHATDDARALIEELEADLAGDFEPHHRHGLSLDKIFQPHIAFFIARVNGKAVGCGGIAFEDGFAELKRMYVRPSARGTGVVQAVITQLESEAKARGVTRLLLETGDTLHAAIRVYERAGFKRCEAFGDYLALPAHTIERSVFLEKRLA